MMRILPMLMAFGMGACMMFWLDPMAGRRRRALARDKAVHFEHEAEDFADAKARHLRDKAQGFMHEARSAMDSMMHREAKTA